MVLAKYTEYFSGLNEPNELNNPRPDRIHGATVDIVNVSLLL